MAFTKIFSALKIGPQFKNPFGFDIIRYRNGLAFDIEVCYVLKLDPTKADSKLDLRYKRIVYKKDLEDLKKSLKSMHKLKIVHCDIKK